MIKNNCQYVNGERYLYIYDNEKFDNFIAPQICSNLDEALAVCSNIYRTTSIQYKTNIAYYLFDTVAHSAIIFVICSIADFSTSITYNNTID